jgi:hypothetical protein
MPLPSIQPLILAMGMTIMVFGIVFRAFAISLGEGFQHSDHYGVGSHHYAGWTHWLDSRRTQGGAVALINTHLAQSAGGGIRILFLRKANKFSAGSQRNRR